MNTDEREERIAIVAEGCKISQEEAEEKVIQMENEAIAKFMMAISNQAAIDTFNMVATSIINNNGDVPTASMVPPRRKT